MTSDAILDQLNAHLVQSAPPVPTSSSDPILDQLNTHIANGVSSSGADAGKVSDVAPKPAATGGGPIKDILAHYQNIKDIDAKYQSGQINLPTATASIEGEIAGPAADLVNKGVSLAGRAAWAMTDPLVKKQLTQGASYVANTPIVKDAAGAVTNFMQAHPQTAMVAHAAGNVASALPLLDAAPAIAGKVANAGTNVAGKVADGASNLATGISARTPEELAAAAKAVKSDSSANFKTVKNADVKLTPEATQGVMDQITQALQENGELDDTLHKNTVSIIGKMQDQINAAAENGEGLSLGTLENKRQLLGDAVSSNTSKIDGTSKDGQTSLVAKKALSSALDDLTGDHLASGDADAIDTLTRARAGWAKYQALDDIRYQLQAADGDPNKIKSALTRFINNPKNTAGWSADEKAALYNAAANSAPEKLLKMFGKFGIDLGTSMTPGNTFIPAVEALGGAFQGHGVEGAAHAAPVIAAGTAARQLQKYLARGKADKLFSAIEARQLPAAQAASMPPSAFATSNVTPFNNTKFDQAVTDWTIRNGKLVRQ